MKRNLPLRALLALTAAGLALAACDRKESELIAAQAVGPEIIGYGPTVDALPAGQPAPVGEYAPEDGYRWAEEAYYLNYAFESEEPDYVYEWNGVEPWAWRSANGWYRIAEPLSAGERYYYYRPREDDPFFVVDDGYGYGFDNGRLVAIYDPSGRLMPRDYLVSHADWGGRYLRRGADLYAARAAAREIALDRGRWDARQGRLSAETTRFAQAALAQPDWRAFRRRVERLDTAERAALAAERERRRDAREAARDVRREIRRDAAVPRRDDNPGVAKRSPRAGEVHARNEERKALRDEIKRERKEERGKGRGKGKGRDKDRDGEPD